MRQHFVVICGQISGVVWMTACQPEPSKSDGAGDSSPSSVDSAIEDTAAPDGVLAVCAEGSVWTPGTVAFTDASASWGLEALMPVGGRVSVGDIDADGWPDLVVRNGTGGEDFSADGTRNTWLLRNQGDGTFADVTESSGFTTARAGGSARSAPEPSLNGFGRPT